LPDCHFITLLQSASASGSRRLDTFTEEESAMGLDNLLTPVNIGNLELRNRIVFPPIDVQIHSEDRRVQQRYIDFLTSLAGPGGVGLVISEFTSVANDRFWAPASRIDSNDYIPGFRRMVDEVKKHGARIFLQLAMLGGRAPKGRCIAPSAMESPLYAGIPEELTREEIQWLLMKWLEGAERAKRIGFDGVEVHGGHSYLLGEFMSPHSNLREDDYGGDFEGRMRFPTEIVKGIKAACGQGFPVGVKFSAFEALPDGIRGALAVDIAQRLEKAGADYLHVSSSTYLLGGTPYPDVPPLFVPEGPLVGFAARIKKKVSVPVITVAGIVSPEFADRIVAENRADLVAVGRAMFADPEWASKVSRGLEKEVRPCIRCNMCHKKMIIDRAGEVECTVNPGLLRPPLKPPRRKKKILVVGAGPAGLEAALTADMRGHRVLLFDREDGIGGNVRLGCIPPFKSDLRRLLDHYALRLERSTVDYRPGRPVTAQDVRSHSPDAVVLAAGSEEIVPDIPGMGGETVVQARDFYASLELQAEGKGKTAVIGAGTVGCELAWYLSLLGRTVFLVDVLPYERWLEAEHPTNRFTLLEKLAEHGVSVLDSAAGLALERGGTLLRLQRDGIDYGISVDGVVLAAGYRPSEALSRDIGGGGEEGGAPAVYRVGDCAGVRDIHWAAREGYEAGSVV
jgi:2,4-dienoyl-CoA reductase-like NADH-dependent reductase (Old Yellow Enzyme family)/thioredoxin reductase